MARCEVINASGARFTGARRLSAALESLMVEMGLSGREMTVVLVNDAEIAERNLADRGVTGPTDVLSYPTAEPTDVGFPEVTHLGDVLISRETAKAQARAAAVPLAHEVVALAAHGLVHLTGLDHFDAEEWAPFTAAQDRAVALYAAGGGAAGRRAGPRPEASA